MTKLTSEWTPVEAGDFSRAVMHTENMGRGTTQTSFLAPDDIPDQVRLGFDGKDFTVEFDYSFSKEPHERIDGGNAQLEVGKNSNRIYSVVFLNADPMRLDKLENLESNLKQNRRFLTSRDHVTAVMSFINVHGRNLFVTP